MQAGKGRGFALKKVLLATLFIVSVIASTGHASALPSFSEAEKRAVFLSPVEQWYPTWNLPAFLSPLEQAGYHVDVLLNENVSISFLAENLTNYDIIILRTTWFQSETKAIYYCSGEPVNHTSTTFAGEISSQELGIDICVGFTALFMQSSYPPGSLRHGLIYVFGAPGDELSTVFLAAGASAFIGYSEHDYLMWGRMDAFSQALFTYLSQGLTVSDSIGALYFYVCRGHGETAAWPEPYWAGNGKFKI
jgi:hypothetical protein